MLATRDTRWPSRHVAQQPANLSGDYNEIIFGVSQPPPEGCSVYLFPVSNDDRDLLLKVTHFFRADITLLSKSSFFRRTLLKIVPPSHSFVRRKQEEVRKPFSYGHVLCRISENTVMSFPQLSLFSVWLIVVMFHKTHIAIQEGKETAPRGCRDVYCKDVVIKTNGCRIFSPWISLITSLCFPSHLPSEHSYIPPWTHNHKETKAETSPYGFSCWCEKAYHYSLKNIPFWKCSFTCSARHIIKAVVLVMTAQDVRPHTLSQRSTWCAAWTSLHSF